MNLLSISWRNLRVRVLSTTLTTLSVALGAMLLCAIWLMIEAAERHFRGGQLGFPAVVGPKQGSALEVVLNTVFNRGVSPGLVPFRVYQELHDEKLDYRGGKLRMRYVIPQARGDNYKGYPIIGTTDEMFLKFRRASEGPLGFARGGPFVFSHEDLLAFVPKLIAHLAEAGQHTHEHKEGDPAHEHDAEGHMVVPPALRQAVLGAAVARRLGLDLGAKIVATHGLADDAGAHVHEESTCEVVGILAATRTAIDEAIFIPLATFLAISDHQQLKEGQAADAGSLGLSAIIVNPADRLGPNYLRDAFQLRPEAQVAFTNFEVSNLLQLVGDAAQVLRVLSYFVLAVAGLAILVALYNTMNERRREIAIMRSLGARRGQILRILLQESTLVSLVGAVLGIAACHLAAWVFAGPVERLARVPVDPLQFSLAEFWLILGTGLLGGFAGILPAIKGSMVQVADNLGPTS